MSQPTYNLWGVHYYDTGPRKNTVALWSAYWNKTSYGGPWSLYNWLMAAAAHGKKLAVSEWGVWRDGGEAARAADDPFYIFEMFQAFYRYAPYIAYETYFDAMADQHLLCPTSLFPRAAYYYKFWWSRGAL